MSTNAERDRDGPPGAGGRWMSGVASAYLTALWGSLVVILLTVGPTPTLDATRPGAALAALFLIAAGASFLGRGSAGISGAMAGAASAYALAIITTLRAAERNWAFIAPGPATAWQIGVTEALVRSLLVLIAAAVIGALGRELRERGRPTGSGPTRWQPSRFAGLAVAVLISCAALGGTVALVAAAAETSIVLPVQVPTIAATGRGALVTVAPAAFAPGEAKIVTDSDSASSCAACAGGLEFYGPLSDAELASLRVGMVVDEAIDRLPRPAQLWYGGVSLSAGLYAFAHTLVAGPDEPFRLIGLGILTVLAGPTPPVVGRTPGDAPLFVGVEAVVLALHGACVGVVVFRRRRVARLSETGRWLATIGVAAVSSLVLAAGLAFYVSFAGSPF
jgi:hypothetical protein